MPGDRESAWRWTVTILITVALGVAGVAATLIAAGRLPCPVVCSPASTPAPVASAAPSTVDVRGPHVALDPTGGPTGYNITVTITGFGDNERVDIHLEDLLLRSTDTDAGGAVVTTVIIPVSFPAKAGQPLTITALGAKSGIVATATYRFQPS